MTDPKHWRHRSGCSAWTSDHPQEWRDSDAALCDCGLAALIAEDRKASGLPPSVEALQLLRRFSATEASNWAWERDISPDEKRFILVDDLLAALPAVGGPPRHDEIEKRRGK